MRCVNSRQVGVHSIYTRGNSLNHTYLLECVSSHSSVWLERTTNNRKVDGSSPSGSTHRNLLPFVLHVCLFYFTTRIVVYQNHYYYIGGILV